MCTVKNHQVQSIRAGTAINIDVGMSVRIRHGVDLACAFRPGEAFADRGIKHVMCTVKNHQVQGIRAGTTIIVDVGMSVGVRHGVGLACACCPCKAFTDRGI